MSPDSNIILNIGTKIRNRRKRKQITLQQMADKTQLSIGFLSQVERGMSEPSMTALYAISRALDVTPDYLVKLPKQDSDVKFIKSAHREFYQYSSDKEICTIHTSNENNQLDSLIIKIAPNYTSESCMHNVDEVLYCIEGTLLYYVNNKQYTLTPGDVIYVASHTPHSWANPTDTPAVLLWVGSLL